MQCLQEVVDVLLMMLLDPHPHQYINLLKTLCDRIGKMTGTLSSVVSAHNKALLTLKDSNNSNTHYGYGSLKNYTTLYRVYNYFNP